MPFKTLIFLLLSASTVWAQTTFNYFEDTYIKPDGGRIYDQTRYGDDFLIAGKFFDNFYHHPAVIRVDTLGNHLWTTSTFDDLEYEEYDYALQTMYDVLAAEDGNIYSIATRPDPDSFGYERWCFRIDPDDGHILWKTLVTPYFEWYHPACRIYEYKDGRIAVTYITDDDHVQVLQFLDKETGEIMEEHTFAHDGHASPGNIAFDETGDIYYSSNDTLYKVSKIDFSLIWEKVVYNTLLSDDISFISDMYFDEDGSFFILGTMGSGVENGIILRIDPETGEIIWCGDRSGSFYVGDFIDDGENIYVSWQHKYVGGGEYFYRISKFRKTDGHEMWYDSYDMEEYTALGEDCEGNGESAMGLAFNDHGNLCMTGYHGGANWEPAEWGNLTVTKGSGTVLYEKDIDLDISTCDKLSVGYDVYNGGGNSMYYIGHVETASDKFAPLLVKTNEETGEVVEEHYVGGMHQFESYVIAFEHVDSGMAVLKQIGAVIKLERYDDEKNLLWDKDIAKNEYMFGNKLKAGPDGSLWVAAHSVAFSEEEPYYGTSTDSVYAFHFSSDGDLISRAGKLTSGIDKFPIDMEIVHDTAFFATLSSGNIYISRIVGSSFYGYTLLDAHETTEFPYFFTFDCLHHQNNKLMFFAYITSGAGTQCTLIDKSTLTATIVDTVPGIDYVNNITTIGDNIVLLTGSFVYDLHNHAVVVAYNYATKTVLWSQERDGSEFFKSVTDSELEYVYSAGVSDEAYYMSKYRLSDGAAQWDTTYAILDDGDSDYENFDIAFDAFNNYIIVACSYDSVVSGPEDESKQPLIKLIDTAGETIKDIKVYASHTGQYRFHAAAPWNDGSFWAGGNNDIEGYNRAGFIMEFDTTIIPPVIIDTTIIDSCYAFFTYEIDGAGQVFFTNTSLGSDSSDIISYLWNFCDGDTSVLTDPMHIYDIPLTVCACLTITDTMGCTDTYCVDEIIENISSELPGVSLYPNPVNENRIHIYSFMPVEVLGLFDMNNKQFSYEVTKEGNNTWVEPEKITSGVYYLILESNDSKAVYKVVVL